jgi:hypothetical protein
MVRLFLHSDAAEEGAGADRIGVGETRFFHFSHFILPQGNANAPTDYWLSR